MNATSVRSGLALTAVLLATPCILGTADTRMAAQSPEQRLADLVPAIEKNLRQNVIPFWFPRAVDREHGGYTVHYGPNGEPLPGGTKAIVTQARTLWLASRLVRSEFTQPGLREAADAGFRFLRDRMWDREHGGFFWEVDGTGAVLMATLADQFGWMPAMRVEAIGYGAGKKEFPFPNLLRVCIGVGE